MLLSFSEVGIWGTERRPNNNTTCIGIGELTYGWFIWRQAFWIVRTLGRSCFCVCAVRPDIKGTEYGNYIHGDGVSGADLRLCAKIKNRWEVQVLMCGAGLVFWAGSCSLRGVFMSAFWGRVARLVKRNCRGVFGFRASDYP